MRLQSRDFENGQSIPLRFSAEGAAISPSLQWSNVPPDTCEFALLVEDPDAPKPSPFVHWIAYGISANTSQLPAGVLPKSELEFPVLIRQGKNTLLKPGYTAPNPPPWDRAHRYFFRLFALRQPLPLAPGAGRDEFMREVALYQIAEATLMGLYEKRSHKWIKWGAGFVALGIGLAAIFQGTRKLTR